MSFTLKAISEPICSRDGLNHAVLQSLLNFALAKSSDEIDVGHHRQGWWYGETVGSRAWTLSRAKHTSANLAKLKRFSESALKWLVTDGYAQSVSIEIKDQRSFVVIEVTVVLSGRCRFVDGNRVLVSVPFNFER